MTTWFSAANTSADGRALALIRMTLGAMFVWVFFHNYATGAYTAAGYARVIEYFLKKAHPPEAWKAVMSLIAANAALAAPVQATGEIALGALLALGLLTRPAAIVAALFLASLWVSELGTGWVWELLLPTVCAFALALGRAGHTWGVDGLLARRRAI